MQQPEWWDSDQPLIDGDCRAGKHRSCAGGPCACDCHTAEADAMAAEEAHADAEAGQ